MLLDIKRPDMYLPYTACINPPPFYSEEESMQPTYIDPSFLFRTILRSYVSKLDSIHRSNEPLTTAGSLA